MNNNPSQIECPNCGTQINVESLLSHKIEKSIRDELESSYKEKFHEVTQKARNIETAEKNYHQRLTKELEDKEKTLKDKINRQIQEEYTSKFQSYKEDLQKKSKKINELERREIEYQRIKMQLENQEEEYILKLEKQKLAIQQETKKELEKKWFLQQQEKEEHSKLSLMEKEKTIEAMKKQINELKQKAEQGSMQLQGEVQEVAIEEELRKLFPGDEVLEVPKGRSGADSILIIKDDNGKSAGKIIFESKRTKTYNQNWIAKLKQDQRQENAEIAVLVSQVLPQGVDNMALVEGVWVCSFMFLKPLTLLLRDGIIKVHETRDVQKNAQDKMQLLYNFLTSNEFKMQIEAILEGFDAMRQSLSRERLAMEKLWKEREKQLDKVLVNTTQFYASVKGIAGAGVPDIKMLEFEL